MPLQTVSYLTRQYESAWNCTTAEPQLAETRGVGFCARPDEQGRFSCFVAWSRCWRWWRRGLWILPMDNLPGAVVQVGVPRGPSAVEGERELLVVLVLLTPHPEGGEHFDLNRATTSVTVTIALGRPWTAGRSTDSTGQRSPALCYSIACCPCTRSRRPR